MIPMTLQLSIEVLAGTEIQLIVATDENVEKTG